jgi:excinuclease ABC subunit B
MQRAMEESERRRGIQTAYNEAHGITPETIRKNIEDILESVYEGDYVTVEAVAEEGRTYNTAEEIRAQVDLLTKRMAEAARELEFEEAARLRDEIQALKERELEVRA